MGKNRVADIDCLGRRAEDGRSFNDDRLYNSILQIHAKMDNLSGEITNLKVNQALSSSLGVRIGRLEKVVYGACALILIGFMASVITHTTKAETKTITKTAIVHDSKKPIGPVL